MNHSDSLEIAVWSVLGLMMAVALYTDLRFGRIYNWLTIPCMLLGISLNTASHGVQGFLYSMAGAALVLAAFLFISPLVGMGGGDIKLMMAVGALLGMHMLIWAALYSAIIGGVLAVIVMLKHRVLASTTRNMAGNYMMKIAFRAPVDVTAGSRGIKFRYSPAIALGTALALWLRSP